MPSPYAMQFDRTGDSSVLHRVAIAIGDPPPGQVRLRHTVIGLNFIDIYHRTGLYPIPLPAIGGVEAVGVIEAVGSEAGTWRVGDRVGYALGPPGACCTHRLIAADKLVALPDDIPDDIAAAVLLKGGTAEFLARRAVALPHNPVVLVHAAAGGVGLLLCQWLHHLGATVIGTAGTAAKADLARAHGCALVIESRAPDIAAQVRAYTAGAGVAVVYDSVGADTFTASLDCLQRRGVLVSYGNASGPVTGVALGVLAAKGSLTVTRPTLGDYYTTPAERADGTAALFEMVRGGHLKVLINQRYALDALARAHDDLTSRRTTGATLLVP